MESTHTAASAATCAFDATLREIRRLELERHVAELEAQGLTVVAREHFATPLFTDSLRQTVVNVAERRSGVRPDEATGESHAGLPRPTGEHNFYLLFEDPIFEEAVLNPVVLALITYLLGRSCLLSSVTSIIKGSGTPPLSLHSDNASIPPPFPPYAQVANATWLLSDYSRDTGGLAFVPGSHRLCRQPTPSESSVGTNATARPVDAPAGSLVVWHGNTWHGAYSRTVPGLRVSMILYFCRRYLQTQEAFRGHTPREVLARNPRRMATLLGEDTTYGWRSEGPDPSRLEVLVHDHHS